jgi:hypothetical protein
MLKRICICGVVAALCALAAAGQASATSTVSFQPNPVDMYDLDHDYYYSWGISYQLPSGQTLTGAVLSIANINNTVTGTNILYVNLLDNPQTGVHYGYDGSNNSNYWASSPLVGTYTDTDMNHSQNISFDLGAAGLLSTLTTYDANGLFGFGFDPECHYDNTGVTLTLTFDAPHVGAPVPEPITMAGVLMAVGALGTYARRRISAR